MTDPWLTSLRQQLDEIAGRLDDADVDRDAVKRDIIALFKRVDLALTDLGQMPHRGAGSDLRPAVHVGTRHDSDIGMWAFGHGNLQAKSTAR